MSSKTRTTYVGVTNDLERRVYEHQSGLVKGFTSKYSINQLVYYEEYDYVYDAIAREKQIKAWSRAKKVTPIKEFNPKWKDLGKDWFTE